MKLLHVKTKREVQAEILEVEDEDYKLIKKSKEFGFDWSLERKYNVFKIVTLENEEIQGLLSVINIKDEFRIHINLIENANSNRGKNKMYDRVAGCLLAFAVQIAFEKGYLGFTSLIPKTELIGLYIKKYGFSQYGRQLAIERKEAIGLIKKYF
ncbi:MAG: hypothetical protein AAFP19_19075 [Bacteroidota bacterium]